MATKTGKNNQPGETSESNGNSSPNNSMLNTHNANNSGFNPSTSNDNDTGSSQVHQLLIQQMMKAMKQGFDTQDERLTQTVTTCVQNEISSQIADLKTTLTEKMDSHDDQLLQVGTDLTQIKEGIVTDKIAQDKKIDGIKKKLRGGHGDLEETNCHVGCEHITIHTQYIWK